MIYDSSFNGLLSAIAWCLRNRQKPLGFLSDQDPAPLLDSIAIPEEPRIRRLFRRHLAAVAGQTAGPEVLDTVYRAFLSEAAGMANWIYEYLCLALNSRRNPVDQLYLPAVAAVAGASRRVAGQAHQYLGLLRFKRLGDHLFLAEFEPDYHVLPLILPHFADRLYDQEFVICDRRRGIAAWHQANGACSLHRLAETGNETAAGPDQAALPDSAAADPLTAAGLPAGTALPAETAGQPVSGTESDQAAKDDPEYERMWRHYLKHLTIPERRNLLLQRSHMPKKYWKYLTENPFVP
ncbi:MAG: TIGR03915 family putative DNA repair protein [Clostridiaceae bacterium]|nr:TIGR03915 family putative DNA repair protein [Clostridiaceae bacterium]